MYWDSDWNKAAAMMIIFAVAPPLKRWRQRFIERAKRDMPDGWLKFALTHEFGKRSPRVSNEVRVIRKNPL